MLDVLIPSTGELIMFGRVLLALLLGGVIGFEREASHKPAGLRTHILVATGTAAFTLVSIHGFATDPPRDPSRVAAQIVSGIGFLGAGTIFRSGSEVRGLTTAATVWLVAAIGMLAGVGMYWLAIFTTALSAVVLRFLHGRFSERARAADDPLGEDEGPST